MANMDMDRSSNGEYKYQREDEDIKSRMLDKESDEKDHQIDKAGEYVRELLQEKLELDNQKSPNAIRLLDQGKEMHPFFLIVLLVKLTRPMEDLIKFQ